MKWSVELGQYDIRYRPKIAMKAQVLADFVAEFSTTEENEDSKLMTDKVNLDTGVWTLYVDGMSNSKGKGEDIVLRSPSDEIIEPSFRLSFNATNNVAEYKALIAGMQLARHLNVKRIEAYSDSQLVVNQGNGEFETKEDIMVLYRAKVQKNMEDFDYFVLKQQQRDRNSYADALVSLVSAVESNVKRIITVEHLKRPAILVEETEVLSKDVPEECWMDEYIHYLKEGRLPAERVEERKLLMRVIKYVLVEDKLYKRSYSGPLLKCVHPVEVNYVMAELHEAH